MSTNNNHTLGPEFTDLLEALLSGNVICEYRYPKLYRFLKNPDETARDEAERILNLMGRALTEDGGLFFAVYTDANREAAHQAIKDRFKTYMDEADLIHEFFDLLREAVYGGEAPDVGDRFTFGHALERVTASRAYTERLIKTAARVSRRDNPEPEVALRSIIDRMVPRGYLHRVSRQAQEYVIAGEFALFNQWFRFALEQEGYNTTTAEDNDSLDAEQGTLL